jgi:hypothetical protein
MNVGGRDGLFILGLGGIDPLLSFDLRDSAPQNSLLIVLHIAGVSVPPESVWNRDQFVPCT